MTVHTADHYNSFLFSAQNISEILPSLGMCSVSVAATESHQIRTVHHKYRLLTYHFLFTTSSPCWRSWMDHCCLPNKFQSGSFQLSEGHQMISFLDSVVSYPKITLYDKTDGKGMFFPNSQHQLFWCCKLFLEAEVFSPREPAVLKQS